MEANSAQLSCCRAWSLPTADSENKSHGDKCLSLLVKSDGRPSVGGAAAVPRRYIAAAARYTALGVDGTGCSGPAGRAVFVEGYF